MDGANEDGVIGCATDIAYIHVALRRCART